MPAPAINLSGTQVLITNGASGIGIVSQDNKTQFGTVQKVSDLCDKVVAGNLVNYEVSKIIDRWVYGSTIYILINEENISGVEVIPP